MTRTLPMLLVTVLLVSNQVAAARPAPDNAPTAAECVAPTTQKRMNDCAYGDFLTANSGYADSNKAYSSKLAPTQRDLFRRSQMAWLAYRTATCAFESGAVRGGSAQAMVRWQCAARMTRARAAEVTKMGSCTEGDLACVRVG